MVSADQVPVGTGAPQGLGVKRVQDACLSFPGASHGFLEMGWDVLKVSLCEMQSKKIFFFLLAGKTDCLGSQNLCDEQGWLRGNKALALLLRILPSEALQDIAN